MAIVTPYPVGSVTDPFGACEDCVITNPYDHTGVTDPYTDCDTGCTTDVSSDPYPTATFVYDPPWTVITAPWAVGGAEEEGKQFISYDGNYFFIREDEDLYQVVFSSGAYTKVASEADKSGYRYFLGVDDGALKGLYCARRGNTYNATRLIKWNDVNAWTSLTSSKNNGLYSMVYSSSYLYIGSQFGIERWDGSSLVGIVRANTFSDDFVPFYMWIVSGTLWAFCINDLSTTTDYKKGCIATWDMSGSPASPGSLVQQSDLLSDCSVGYPPPTVWYDGTVFLSRSSEELVKFNTTSGLWETVIAASSGTILSIISHSDGWLYAFTNTQQLLKWQAGEADWTEVVSGSYNNLSTVHRNNLVEADYDIYCTYCNTVGWTQANTIAEVGVTTSGCAIADPYDYESLCTDTDYTT